MIFMKQKWIWSGLVVLAAVAVAALIVVKREDMLNQDFFIYWLAGKFAAAGGNVYDMTAWDAAHVQYGSTWLGNPFFYPLYFSFLLIPFGLLPLRIAAILWIALSILIVTWVTFTILHQADRPISPFYVGVVLFGVFCFRAVIVTMLYGQIGAVLTGCILLGAVLIMKGKPMAGGAVLAVTLIKPTVGLPVLGLFCLYFILRREWQALCGAAATAVVFLAASFAVNPGWVPAFLAQGMEKGTFVFRYTPTWWGQATNFCGWTEPCATTLGAIGSILLVILWIWLLVRSRRQLDALGVASLAVITALQVTPYLWAYDHILLIIPIVQIGADLFDRKKDLIAAVAPLLLSLFSLLFILIAVKTVNDNLSFWVTFTVAILWLWLPYRGKYARKSTA